jgi:imidazole glycerol phosphate synthase subunit HisF
LRIAQDNGISEALPTSIEKDGTGKGPDLELIEFVGKHVKVPVIYGGGNRMWVVLIERSLRQIKFRDRGLLLLSRVIESMQK